MICDSCKQNPAKIIVKKIVDGYQSEIHLCETCAQNNDSSANDSNFDITEFIKGILNMQNSSNSAPFPEAYGNAFGFGNAENIKCPTCNLSIGEFRKTVKFGCDDCYKTFDKIIEPIVRRMHSRTIHTGKVSKSAAPSDKGTLHEMAEIQQQLAKAISDEDYEQAAIFRDKLRQLREVSKAAEGKSNE
ncbi:MAG: UvrB/UvrC motif-containing protein [Eubacteriaceae bacterium]|nr:UvrB/UvrC motif-containing protein [Eubacteriaceae bacterium]